MIRLSGISRKELDDLLNASPRFPQYSILEELIYFSRPDLMQEFYFFEKSSPQKMRDWLLTYGIHEYGLEKQLNKLDTKRISSSRNSYDFLGLLPDTSGISFANRSLIKCLENADRLSQIGYIDLKDKTEEGNNNTCTEPPIRLGRNPVVLGFNANITKAATNRLTKGFNNGEKIVGYWSWEIDKCPSEFLEGMKLVDEIWTVSNFCAETFSKYTKKRIKVIPNVIDKNTIKFSTRLKPLKKIYYPYVLFIFDFDSCFERKNPIDLIKVYNIAAIKSGVKLVIKTSNHLKHLSQYKKLIAYATRNKNIVIIERNLNDKDLMSLIKHAFVYASLHRAEGFGLTMAQAMFLGVPCLATGYSGNLDFMNVDNSLLVNYKKIKITHKAHTVYYNSRGEWAQPDIDDSVDKLRSLMFDAQLRLKLTLNAKKFLNNNFNLEKISSLIIKN
jgi:glycosyltransferase involved in cell wall biosynthesis